MPPVISTPADLFTAHHRRFLAVASRILHNQEDAEDTVQDAFLDICQSWGQCRSETAVHWATAIVHNRALDALRKRRASCRIPAGMCQPITELLEPSIPSHEREIVARLVVVRALDLAHLSQRQAEALRDWAEGGMDGDHATKMNAFHARVKVRAVIG
jgi:RNA polymerase sigma factor (sigma-70 family)